jgi:hypothetical protein
LQDTWISFHKSTAVPDVKGVGDEVVTGMSDESILKTPPWMNLGDGASDAGLEM